MIKRKKDYKNHQANFEKAPNRTCGNENGYN